MPIDFPTYGNLRRGSRGPRVAALECLLRKQRVFHAKVDERFDGKTAKAVERFQRGHPRLATTGRVSKRVWVALLADGRAPLLKVGAASDIVRRLQRALNAATRERLEISGVYDKPTAKAVKRYQRAIGVPRTGVTTDLVWDPLKAGRR